MKKIGFLLGVLIASACATIAQISVEVSLQQEQFLPGEALPVAVRITNRSGQTLNLGSDPAWLTFTVESREGFIVMKKQEVPVTGAFVLESSKLAIKRVDLAPCFELTRPAHYSIVATLRIKEWNQQINSTPRQFDIIQGSKLWEQVVGIPKTPGATNVMPELRRYTLHEANYLRKQLMLYVQVTGPTGKIYKVFAIGPMIAFGKPEPQVDKSSNLHVLYQDGPHSFNYTIIDPDGTMLVRQTYDYTTRPRLVPDEEGNFKVIGGERRITATDLPSTRAPTDAPPLSGP